MGGKFQPFTPHILLNHVKSITMTHMLNLLLCRVEGDKFQKWLKMPMFFTCSTYWLAVGEGIIEYKNDYISLCSYIQRNNFQGKEKTP